MNLKFSVISAAHASATAERSKIGNFIPAFFLAQTTVLNAHSAVNKRLAAAFTAISFVSAYAASAAIIAAKNRILTAKYRFFITHLALSFFRKPLSKTFQSSRSAMYNSRVENRQNRVLRTYQQTDFGTAENNRFCASFL